MHQLRQLNTLNGYLTILLTYQTNVDGEFDSEADGNDENDGRNCAQFDSEQTHRTEKLNNDCSQNDDYHRRYPRTHQDETDDKENGGQDRDETHGEPETEVDILLPESERNSGWEIGETPFFKLFTDLSDSADCVDSDLSVTEVVKVEWDPREDDWLRLWDLEVGVPMIV